MKHFALTLVLASVSTLVGAKPIPKDEQVSSLMEGRKEIVTLVEIQKTGLNQAVTGIDLWSGHYWPHYQGSLAIRYRDSSFIGLMKNHEQFDKFKELSEKKPLYTYSGNENLLSPAEKYDLLVGDPSMSLTKYSWSVGEKAEKLGKVPTWRGICDGWSSAAQKMPRPVKSVRLKTSQNSLITFFPEDIKALGSLLYARAQENVIFLGKRCYPVIGLFTGACAGTNPGTLHKALVNRVGLLKKTFNADVSTSSEVWNYPVKSYKFTYYNVFDGEESANFNDVYEVFQKKNRFSRSLRRDENTYAIVGVKAEVVFADMRGANLLETDSATQDQNLVKIYNYDLELDRNFQILGGEWYSNMPDFIWAPNDRTYPLSDAEESGSPTNTFDMIRAAQISSKVGQPLSVIVEKLFELSK